MASKRTAASTSTSSGNVLPDDKAALQSLVVKLQGRVDQQSLFIDQLLEQIRLARHHRFGARSERFTADQLALVFNEAEAITETSNDDNSDGDGGGDEPSINIPSHRRRRGGGRGTLSKHLPRIDIVHELAPSDCHCGQCQSPLTPISEKVSEQLDIVPAQVRVLRHVRRTYACPCCEGQLVTAPMPAQPIPKSLASPGTLAYIATSKFVDSMPLYRLEKKMARIDVELPRSRSALWMIRAGQLIQPLINLMRDQMLSYDIIGMDETRLQVLKEPDRAAQSQSYLWVQRGGPPDQPLILFDYHASRSHKVALGLLEGYQGYLQTDGYAEYDKVCTALILIALGCWAHVRRRFDEAINAQKGLSAEKQKHSLAAIALAKIQALYRIEREIKALAPEAKQRVRQSRSKPLLDDFRTWLDEHLPLVPSQSALGKAMNYAHRQWPKLIVYVQDGRLQIDNNLVENIIRPFVIGRKNYLFCDTVAGANASANLYSLIETAKANGIEPYAYLREVFTRLPMAATVEDIEALLPFSIDQERLLKTA